MATLNQTLGLNQPQMQNALGLAKAMMGLMQGIDDDGGAALVFTSFPTPSIPMPGQDEPVASGEPQGLVLLPINSYAGFLNNFGIQHAPESGGDAGAGVQEFPFMNQQVFVKQAGEYVVISNDKNQVTNYVPPVAGNSFAARASHFGQEVMTNSDISVLVDLSRLSAVFRPVVRKQLSQMGQMFKQFGGADVQTAELMDAYLSVYGDMMDVLFRDGDLMMVGVDLSRSGVGFSYICQFKEDSELANVFVKNPAHTPSLNRLPKRPFLVAMDMNTSMLPAQQWFSRLVTAFPEDTGWAKLFATVESLLEESTTEWQTVVAAPSPGVENSLGRMAGLNVVTTDDPDGYARSYKQCISQLNAISLNGLTYHTELLPATKEISGHEISEYTISFEASGQIKQQLGPMGANLQEQTGAVFQVDDAVVIAVNSDDALLKDATTSASGDGGLEGNAGIASVRKRLPERRVGEIFINVGSLVEMISKSSGGHIPISAQSVSADLPPAGAAVGVYQGTIGVRGFVPMPVITAVKNAVTNAISVGAGPPIARH